MLLIIALALVCIETASDQGKAMSSNQTTGGGITNHGPQASGSASMTFEKYAERDINTQDGAGEVAINKGDNSGNNRGNNNVNNSGNSGTINSNVAKGDIISGQAASTRRPSLRDLLKDRVAEEDVDKLEKEGVTSYILADLTDEELKDDFGIDKKASRRAILKAAKE